ncbi:glutaredoxin family protein [Microbacterium sp. zg.B48]|uniref:glutaredoxin family protein n=1 Tax=unclassified Microbacterium TaxID=2609290 RepID=UPI00214B926E|nr:MULTISPECIES: glutaredoxin family protein [unclassified Microbacterium]MCR2764571.1 glutaredoxin family protein [Microbacterium sp. zg.B48]MCR2810839.1 glutaredoxin family protein [Microbacterium sp. zg.B185]WIM19756.1 glutaredoxin family protein [Microbacterium sp. zg-B185]
MTTVTVIGKPGCHLCAVAREIVDVVVSEAPEDRIVVEELSIADDPALYELWWEKIPVVLIDGAVHAHWRVSADRLRTALNVPYGRPVGA